MTSTAGDPQARFLVLAIVMLALAAGAIKWAGRALRAQLGSGGRRAAKPFSAGMVADVPPALVKRALERGLVTPAQVAGMSAEERRFVFASLSARLAEPSAAPGGGSVSAARRPEDDAPRGPSSP
jgi:hypothetical protein